MTITNAQSSDAGVYGLLIGTASGVRENLSATLTVTNAPPPALTLPRYTNGNLQFTLTGEAGSNYVVQSSTDLGASNWVSRVTNAAPFQFVETNLGLSPQRFYRAVIP